METDSGYGKRQCIIAVLISSFIIAASFASFILIDFTDAVLNDPHNHYNKNMEGDNPMISVFNS